MSTPTPACFSSQYLLDVEDIMMERTKDKSEDINESQEKEMVTASEKSSESIKTTKNRPKTAPPIQQQVVVSYFIESVKV